MYNSMDFSEVSMSSLFGRVRQMLTQDSSPGFIEGGEKNEAAGIRDKYRKETRAAVAKEFAKRLESANPITKRWMLWVTMPAEERHRLNQIVSEKMEGGEEKLY